MRVRARVCVCVCERERGCKKDRDREKQREKETELGVIPFIKLQNDTLTTVKRLATMKNEMES